MNDDGYQRGLMAAANLCADRAIAIRDNGSKSKEGILSAAAGAHVGVWLAAELAIRALAPEPRDAKDTILAAAWRIADQAGWREAAAILRDAAAEVEREHWR